ncbi:MAG: hypothetical protein NC213_06235 [Acetobacter sp.]|nr:hypothetical protein [Bacteroides sp.]MCM1341325.1 hypothetical protein [Acetobacter sp.]MCM1433899.1 hypothetical protein [Clostridiales bacterium]
MDNLIFKQTEKYSFRDPTAYIFNGEIYLFFSLVINENNNQYFCTAVSKSKNFKNWTKPEVLTEKDISKNYSSPGNVVEYNGMYYLCLQTYPRPNGEKYGNESSRIFTIHTSDFKNWSKPELIKVKGDIPENEMGRMIDPYILKDNDKFICFFKQNGVSFSESSNMKNWKFKGYTECGENVCVIKENDEYIIFNSLENGINLLSTKNFKEFNSMGTTYLNQSKKPWAKDRITAGFVIDISKMNIGYNYAMFYHGDMEDHYIFGASLAVTFSNDLKIWN